MIYSVMWKPPKNPEIEELTKSCKDRSVALSGLKAPKREDGKNGCLWCGGPLKSKHPATRYCKDEACSDNIWAWANPQSNNGLFYILHRQNWKCNGCQYDYREFMINEVNGKHYGTKNFDFETKFHWPMTALKMAIPPALKPEVDHIIPIFKGGTSLGLDNHQVICYTCHKAKTKKDVTGRKKKL